MIDTIVFILTLLIIILLFIYVTRQLDISYNNGYFDALKHYHRLQEVDVNLIQDEITYNDKKGTFYFLPDKEQQ